jgi:hypothetical protein
MELESQKKFEVKKLTERELPDERFWREAHTGHQLHRGSNSSSVDDQVLPQRLKRCPGERAVEAEVKVEADPQEAGGARTASHSSPDSSSTSRPYFRQLTLAMA